MPISIQSRFLQELTSMEEFIALSYHEMATITTTRKFEAVPPPDLYPPSSTSSSSEETLVSELSDIPLPPPSKAPQDILSVDRDTPDHHVPRDPRLIRLTGVHPFNVEAPLTQLFDEGAWMLQSIYTRTR